MTISDKEIQSRLDLMQPITLEEMSGIRLMNRLMAMSIIIMNQPVC